MITINMNKAREITHEKRRAARADEFAPLDDVIAKQIPGSDAVEAEAKRQEIRKRYAVIQNEIDGCDTSDELKTIIERLPV